MLSAADTILTVVDVQGKLATLMADHDQVIDNVRRLLNGMELFAVPAVVTEQLPDKLGATVDPLQPHIQQLPLFTKASFSCWGAEPYRSHIRESGKKQMLVAGIETHVCVYQTVRDMLTEDFEVFVVADAVSSRAVSNRELGLRRMEQLGAILMSTEMVLFELMRVAEGDAFRELLKIVR